MWYFSDTAQKELCFPLIPAEEEHHFHPQWEMHTARASKCTTTNRAGNGGVPNLKDRNTCYENSIWLIIPKLPHSTKSKHTISRIYCKRYYKTIKSPSASTPSSSAVQLCSSKLHLSLQTSFLGLFIPFQFHHPSSNVALLAFPEFAVPAEDSKGQQKDQNQW